MEYELKGININITPAFEEYVHEKFEHIERLLTSFNRKDAAIRAHIEVVRTTRHHKKGDFILVNATILVSGITFRSSSESFDARVALDEIKDELTRQIASYTKKKNSKYLRGARLLKRITRLSPLAWFGWNKGSRDRDEGI